MRALGVMLFSGATLSVLSNVPDWDRAVVTVMVLIVSMFLITTKDRR